MGLAASQAKLLTITSRMHDVEFEAQSIMQKKVALATQKDTLYQEYCDALDAKKIQVAVTNDGGVLNYVDATFDSVCGYNSRRVSTFALTDASSGEMVVSDDVYDAYQDFRGKDKYSFAFEMLGFEREDGCSEDSIYDSTLIGVHADGECGFGAEYAGTFEDVNTAETVAYILMNDVEAAVYKNHEDNLADKMQKFNEALATKDKTKVEKAVEEFRKALYGNSLYVQEIFNGMTENSQFDKEDFGDFDKGEFDYYVRLFEGIEAAGGCVPLSEYSEGTTADNDWFNNVVKNGQLILNQYMTGANKGWQTVSTATCTSIQEVSDEVAIKKAEARYNYELSLINNKDKRFDQDLNKLETERTALDTERESVEKVINDNIERSFKIFS